MGIFDAKALRFLRFVLVSVFVVAVVIKVGSSWQGDVIKGYLTPGQTNPAETLPLYPPKDQVKVSICHEDPEPSSCPKNEDLPIIYIVTPTYSRREQIAELTRLAQTLLHVPNFHWVIAEDSDVCHKNVMNLAKRYEMPRTHIASPIPVIYKSLDIRKAPRGVSSRRAGLQWVLKRQSFIVKKCPRAEAVIYFADDDNTYDLRIFEEIRTTKKVSVFPVGLIGLQSFSSPVVVEGRVIGFADPWYEKRKFPVDMAGFATSVNFILKAKKAGGTGVGEMPYKVGFEEDIFLKSLNLELKDLEPLGSNCTEVLVWHTKTVKETAPNLKRLSKINHLSSNIEPLIRSLSDSGIVKINDRVGYKIGACMDPKGCETTPLKRF